MLRERTDWFSRLLLHPARKRSGSVLSTCTGAFTAIRHHSHTSSQPYVITAIRHRSHTSSQPYVIAAIRHHSHTSSQPYVITAIRHHRSHLVSSSVVLCCRAGFWQGSHSFTDKKIQDFSRTFQDPHEKLSRTFSEPANV